MPIEQSTQGVEGSRSLSPYPLGQVTHVVVEALECFPTAHGTHGVAAELSVSAKPAAQGVQDKAPIVTDDHT